MAPAVHKSNEQKETEKGCKKQQRTPAADSPACRRGHACTAIAAPMLP